MDDMDFPASFSSIAWIAVVAGLLQILLMPL